jgi:hypothetical protein
MAIAFRAFVIDNSGREKERESLLLQALLFYIGVLDKQAAKFHRKIRYK